ncbi:MFS transporter [Streptomyces anulatus]
MSSRFIMGLGYGVYLAVDTALVTKVLPASADRGKDMALANLMTSLPYVLVPPPIASLLLGGPGGYSSLFLCSAAMSALGAVLVWKVKSIR